MSNDFMMAKETAQKAMSSLFRAGTWFPKRWSSDRKTWKCIFVSYDKFDCEYLLTWSRKEWFLTEINTESHKEKVIRKGA